MGDAGQSGERAVSRPWSFRLATVAGIPIRIHFTFALLLLYLGLEERARHGHVAAQLFFVVGVFGCVVLHELGHALTAQLYGIKTRDIVLYPIGGVASLSSLGTPKQEFWITAAGPSVNIVLAALFYAGAKLAGVWIPIGELLDPDNLPIVQRFWMVNLFLALFNLIPAFPMDGGRLLRSSLSWVIGRDRATRFAAGVGQVIALLFGAVGLFFSQTMLVLIAIFVFLAAGQESMATRAHTIVVGRRVREAMIDHFEALHHSDTLGVAAEKLLHSSQQDFPVVDGGDHVIGVLTRKGLLAGLAAGGRDAYVSEAMAREFDYVSPNDGLELAMAKLMANRDCPVLVFDEGRLVGLVTNEIVAEYLMIRELAPFRRNG